MGGYNPLHVFARLDKIPLPTRTKSASNALLCPIKIDE
jgi:hypothetical protein